MDKLIPLAFSVHSNPGVFALLLGSGVSRAAGIPTGWGVTVELIRQVAAVQKEDAGEDPEKWYQEAFSCRPDYSAVLAKVAPSQVDRQAVLKQFFEPSAEDRAAKRKTPTDAHRAVAALAAKGLVRVIVTTNFDRLTELALEDAGVRPVVIATDAQAEGASPLQHNACTIIKAHGDYLDARIRNTEEELAKLGDPMANVLTRVFDEYGLIVCGWSGEYDEAIRNLLSARRSRRYSIFWCTKGPLGERSKDLATGLAAEVVNIKDADSFFGELRDSIEALARAKRPHFLAKDVAVERMKEYLSEERFRIRRKDLTDDLARVALSPLDEPEVHTLCNGHLTWLELRRRLERYEAAVEPLCGVVSTMVKWGRSGGLYEVSGFLNPPSSAWLEPIQRLFRRARTPRGGDWEWLLLRSYPAAIAFYTAGVTACLENDLSVLRQLFGLMVRQGDEDVKAVDFANCFNIFGQKLSCLIPGDKALPGNERMRERVREVIFSPGIDDDQFLDAFDRFEYLLSLWVFLTDGWAPPGLFALKGPRGADFVQRMADEARSLKLSWGPLVQGLFEVSVDHLLTKQEEMHKEIRIWRRGKGTVFP